MSESIQEIKGKLQAAQVSELEALIHRYEQDERVSVQPMKKSCFGSTS